MAKEVKLDECLKLLNGESDEQKLVGLLLATKFVKGDDMNAVRQIFEATGFHFIDGLLKAGSSRGGEEHSKGQPYQHLALSVLAAFCRLPDVAASQQVVEKVPIFMTILSNNQDEAAAGDCCECLLAVAMSSERGIQALLGSKVFDVVSHRIHKSADADWTHVAVKLLHSLLIAVAGEKRVEEYVQDLTLAVAAISLQLSIRQDLLKFEALALLYALLASDVLTFTKTALAKSVRHSQWPAHARTGLGQILHSRVAVQQKYLALEAAESIVEIVGDSWLIGTMNFPERHGHAPPDRFFLLVVETLRVEAAVLLNEVAQAAFDGPRPDAQTSTAAQASAKKAQTLMKCFALLEHLINILGNQEENTKTLGDRTLEKAIVAIDESVGLVLEFLTDAQEHNEHKGDVLLASVRIIGRYLAEAPSAHQERCRNLLQFILSIGPTSDNRPFLAIQFMLPFLTQMTLDDSGCQIFLASKSNVQVVNFLSWAVHMPHETKSAIVHICETLLNLLDKDHLQLIDSTLVEEFIPVLPSLVLWVGQGVSKIERAMAASVLTSILALTDENHLKSIETLGVDGLQRVFSITISSLEYYMEENEIGGDDVDDLLEIVSAGSIKCVDRYPSYKMALRMWIPQVMDRALSEIRSGGGNPSFQLLLQIALRN